jgi:hypothetical protein
MYDILSLDSKELDEIKEIAKQLEYSQNPISSPNRNSFIKSWISRH